MKICEIVAFATVTSTIVACGASFPAPTDRLASAEGAARSARELGAERDAQAALHLKLAEEQIEHAKKLVDEDNQRADSLAQRASSDAELAVMLAKERNAKVEVEKANEQVKTLKGGN